jgi:CDP-diacylglycerol--glycerol-3-phosphate 3-phosphatidyltransferase
MKYNVATICTFFRVLLIPAIVIAYYLPWKHAHLLAALIFAIAALTDWADGFLARTYNLSTKLGEFLDPVADKLVIASALVMIVGQFGTAYLAVPAAIIVAREIVISALREWMAEIGKRTSVAVGFIGKVKTCSQMVAVFLLLLCVPPNDLILGVIGSLFLYVAAFLTLWSMIMYLKAAWPDLTLSAKKE